MNKFGHGGRIPRPKLLPEVRGEKRPPGAIPPSARKPAIMQDPVLVLNACRSAHADPPSASASVRVAASP